MSTSLTRYRALVPAHATVPDTTVSAWLELAARRHSATAFGDVYVDAMIAYAAANIEPQVLSGLFPVDGHGSICAPPKVDPEAPVVKIPKPEETSYWATYLDMRGSRAATVPRFISPVRRVFPC